MRESFSRRGCCPPLFTLAQFYCRVIKGLLVRPAQMRTDKFQARNLVVYSRFTEDLRQPISLLQNRCSTNLKVLRVIELLGRPTACE